MKRSSLPLFVVTLSACGGVEHHEVPTAYTAPTPDPVAERLIILEELGPPVLWSLDLRSGDAEMLFEVPSYGFAYELDFDPVQNELVLAYTPPPSGDDFAFDRSGIYSVTSTGGVHHLACADRQGVWCSYPTVAGDVVWFARTGEGTEEGVDFAMSSLDRTTGEVRSVIPGATEPAVSEEGDLVWVAVDPVDGTRSLEFGTAEGRHLWTLVAASPTHDLGQPFFSADGLSVFFVRIGPDEVSMVDRALDWLVPSAYAHDSHDVPGDWWRVPVDGESAPERVTALNTVHYDGRADPGGQWIFIVTREGVHQVDLESGAATLLKSTRAARALDWR